MRHPEWEGRLNAAVAKHQTLPGAWGVSDCWTLTTDAIEAVTGERILPDLAAYKSEAAGYRVFAKAGFSTVADALASALPPVSIMLAQRGDVGVIERDGVISSGVFTSAGFAVRTIYGSTQIVAGKKVEVIAGHDLQFFSASAVSQAFQVR